MAENLERERQSAGRGESWRDHGWYWASILAAVALWVGTALWLRPPFDFLFLLAFLLGVMLLIGRLVVGWALGDQRLVPMIAGVVTMLLITFPIAAEFDDRLVRPQGFLSILHIVVVMVTFAIWMRSTRGSLRDQ
jgi:hypothetical protein